MGNIVRFRVGLFRQLAYFFSDNGKTAAGFAGSGRFDSGVKSQQIGLLGNAGDGFVDAADLLGIIIEQRNDPLGFDGFGVNGIHTLHGIMDGIFAVFSGGHGDFRFAACRMRFIFGNLNQRGQFYKYLGRFCAGFGSVAHRGGYVLDVVGDAISGAGNLL